MMAEITKVYSDEVIVVLSLSKSEQKLLITFLQGLLDPHYTFMGDMKEIIDGDDQLVCLGSILQNLERTLRAGE